jgi:DNA replication and repair protein RecF
VFVARLRLVNFRSYCDATVSFSAGLNIVVGENATGKTNLLEGAWFGLRGASPRTRREEKLIQWGARFTRVELVLDGGSAGPIEVQLGYAPREGKRVRWAGAEVSSLDELRRRSQVFIFVPESLLLVKGSPARRRAHFDSFAAALDRTYAEAAGELQEALRQRNAQLAIVKAGGDEGALDVWDTQFAHAALKLTRRRRELLTELDDRFRAAAASLAPPPANYALQLVSSLEGMELDVEAFREELLRRRRAEVSRGISLFGPHRDDLRFVELSSSHTNMPQAAPAGAACGPVDLPAGGRDLRLFGSQGEQRLAVLALLLAEQELATERSTETGILFLDDVMSELDDSRRRLLVRRLSASGQAVITTTNRHYFTESELAGATVVELPLQGSLAGVGPSSLQDETKSPSEGEGG